MPKPIGKPGAAPAWELKRTTDSTELPGSAAFFCNEIGKCVPKPIGKPGAAPAWELKRTTDSTELSCSQPRRGGQHTWSSSKTQNSRVGQNHMYTVYIRYFWQGNHEMYGHIRCIYTVLANPKKCVSTGALKRLVQQQKQCVYAWHVSIHYMSQHT